MRIFVYAVLIGGSLSVAAQTGQPDISSYTNEIIPELNDLAPVSVEEWTRQHAGDTFETPTDSFPTELSLGELEGRWCARSTATTMLEGGVAVRRIALFYPPIVETLETLESNDLPPLPREKGLALIRSGCALEKVFYYFQGVGNPRSTAEAIIASQISPFMYKIHGLGIFDPWDDRWTLLQPFSHSEPDFTFAVAVGDPEGHDMQQSILLIWKPIDMRHGEPSEVIDPKAGQPWLAARAAGVAALPLAPTLDMLSLLAPRSGDPGERPRLHCNADVVPILRRWLALADGSSPSQHAAALVLADAVATRLGECVEYGSPGIPYQPPSPEDAGWKAYDSLTRSLAKLGISMGDTRAGPQYTGNLPKKAMALAKRGVADELARIATIDQPCAWASDSDWPKEEVSVGESILADFAPDEWTASVHLILAEAYIAESDRETPPGSEADLREKAIEHYRKYYAHSTNDRDRTLVWEEIWNLQAGLPPRLMLPPCGSGSL
jgi:hypothetical protein